VEESELWRAALAAGDRPEADLVDRAAALVSVTHTRPEVVRAGADLDHCRRVASRVARYGPDAAAAGWLHDLVQYTYPQLSVALLRGAAFLGIPGRVCDVLRLLTPTAGEAEVDVVERVRLAADPLATAVKVADLDADLDAGRFPAGTRLDLEHLLHRLTRPWTLQEARRAVRAGWNLRCNRCGSYGASWCPGARPGWGALALCPLDLLELEAEHRRHQEALHRLQAVNYEQDPVSPPVGVLAFG
jgi:hypothetical protein